MGKGPPRAFPVPVVFWPFVSQTLGTGSCRHAVSSVQSLLNHGPPVVLSATTAKLRLRLVTGLIELIAADQVPARLFRREPRAEKRRPKPHRLLNKPSHEMAEISRRSRYRKAKRRIITNEAWVSAIQFGFFILNSAR